METNTNEKPIQNNLWRARRRAELERKQVAFLLSKKTSDELSRYERGINLPSLRTALKLEIVYQTPVRLLFQGLFEQLRAEISEAKNARAKQLSGSLRLVKDAEQLSREEFCFYARLLESRIPSSLELESINKHTIALINTVSDYKQNRKPFSGGKSL